MCFSATASLTTAVLLLPPGAYCIGTALKKNKKKKLLMLACFPLLFGIQQAVEGFLWLALESPETGFTHVWALVYLFFSHFFWLIWSPLSVSVLEPHERKRRFFFILAICGGLFGATVYFPMVDNINRLEVHIVNCSISYETALIYDAYIHINYLCCFYICITIMPYLFSSHRDLKRYGILLALSIGGAQIFYAYAFVSTWCFFAAILSLYTAYVVKRNRV